MTEATVQPRPARATRAQVAMLQKALEERTRALNDLSADMKELRDASAALAVSLAEERARSSDARVALEVESNTIADLTDKTHNLRVDLDDKIAQCNALSEQITKLTKDLESAKGTSKYHEGLRQEAVGELEQAHAMLDGLPGAGPRKTPQPEGSYSDVRLTVTTRLTTYLASLVRNPNRPVL